MKKIVFVNDNNGETWLIFKAEGNKYYLKQLGKFIEWYQSTGSFFVIIEETDDLDFSNHKSRGLLKNCFAISLKGAPIKYYFECCNYINTELLKEYV